MLSRQCFLNVMLPCAMLLLAGCEQPSASSPIAAVDATPVDYAEVARAASKRYGGAPVRTIPKAVVDETVFEFGQMEPGSSGSHLFTISNGGSAPLKLEVGETSCKCTLSELAGAEIAPGASTTVRLEWNTGSKFRHYRQWAEINTNDPERATLTFQIQGTVRQEFRCEPEEVAFGDVFPTEAARREVLIYSESWPEFELIKPECTNPEFQLQVSAATTEQLQAVKGLKGYVVSITSPTNLAGGAFQEWLRWQVKRDANDESPESREIPLIGSVKGRISIVGQKINSDGQVEFGTLAYGKGAKTRLKLKVRDQDGDLRLAKINVQPSFVNVTLTPASVEGVTGLYDLVVEVPPDAEPCGYRGDAMGTIDFEFGHPRIKDLHLLVDFSVRPPKETR